MSDKIIFLKNIKGGLIKDTIVNSNDTLYLDLKNQFELIQNQKGLTVHTIAEPLSKIQNVGLWVGAILGVVTILYTLYSTWKLRESDKDTQKQLDKLSGIVGAIEAQNGIINDGNAVMRDYFAELQNLLSTGSSSNGLAEIEQKRFRLSVKPRLWINVSATIGYKGELYFDLNNRGELCYYDDCEFLEGYEVVFHKWDSPIEIPKDGRIKITGKYEHVHPRDLKFKLKIFYHDQEGFKYESIIEWNKSAKIIETIEL